MAGRNMELKQYAEWNITRLGLIPAQSKIPKKYLMGWEQLRGSAENYTGVRCYTAHESGIPYGLAGDLIAAMMTLVTINQPKENLITSPSAPPPGHDLSTLRTSLEELDKLMLGKGRANGQRYLELHQTLQALTNTRYHIENLWQTNLNQRQRKKSVTFSLIEKMALEETIVTGIIEKRIYTIRLDDLLWKSAVGGLILSLDTELLSALDSPTARAIYRMLENHRRTEGGELQNKLSIRAVEFADAIRLLSTSPAISQRLQSIVRSGGAFDQLVREGYLKAADVTGRGDNTMLHFQFAQETELIHTRAQRLLTEAGIQPSYALELARQFTEDEVQCGIWLAEEAIKKQKGTQSEIKNPPGLIIKLLMSGDAQSRMDDFKDALNKQMRVKERLAPKEETPPPAPAKTASEQLETVLKVRKIKPDTAAQLRQATEDNILNASDIAALLLAAQAQEAAEELLQKNQNIQAKKE